jgi:hypothetical protein
MYHCEGVSCTYMILDWLAMLHSGTGEIEKNVRSQANLRRFDGCSARLGRRIGGNGNVYFTHGCSSHGTETRD